MSHITGPVEQLWQPSRLIVPAEGCVAGLTFAAAPGWGGHEHVHGATPTEMVGSYESTEIGTGFATASDTTPDVISWGANEEWAWQGQRWSIFISCEVTGDSGAAKFVGLAIQRFLTSYVHGDWQWFRWPTAFSTWQFQWKAFGVGNQAVTFSSPWPGPGRHTWAITIRAGVTGEVGNIRMYEDGAQIGLPKTTFGKALPSQGTDRALRLGILGSAANASIFGRWESAYIWNRELFAEEVALIHEDPFLPFRTRDIYTPPVTRLGFVGSLQGTAAVGPRLTGTVSSEQRLSGTTSRVPQISGTTSSEERLSGSASAQPRVSGTGSVEPNG